VPASATGPADGSVEVLRGKGVSQATADQLAATLTSHSVQAILTAGLNSYWRGYPHRIPILLTHDDFDADHNQGLFVRTCADPNLPGIVIRANLSAGQLARTAAHELFHAYSDGIADGPDPWWEEAAATWAEVKTGFGEDDGYDVALLRPRRPLDTSPHAGGNDGRFPYALYRFVQFLEGRGHVAAGEYWPLVHDVIAGYNAPGPTQALAAALIARGTSLGEQSAAFWGDRMKKHPSHGRLRLEPIDGVNSFTEKVRPGSTTVAVPAKALTTGMVDFVVGDAVKRVEFEFEPPTDGYFWGLVAPNESREFRRDETVSFCVGGGDTDDLEWPKHFPVTFTNGMLSGGEIEGKIRVYAQTHAAEQCTHPRLNRVCRVMREAAQGILGQVSWLGYLSGFIDGKPDVCTRFGETGGGGDWGSLSVVRQPSAKRARAAVRGVMRNSAQPCVTVRLGDLACVTSFSYEAGGATDTLWVIPIAHGRDLVNVFHTLVPDVGDERGTVVELARAVMRVLQGGP
jgi:hypothetical protein